MNVVRLPIQYAVLHFNKYIVIIQYYFVVLVIIYNKTRKTTEELKYVIFIWQVKLVKMVKIRFNPNKFVSYLISLLTTNILS